MSTPSWLPDPASTLELSPEAVAAWIDLPPGERPRLIDCREADELAICQLPGNEWIPLRKFAESLARFREDEARGFVIYCHHGMRSQHAANFLRSHGIENAFSMSGGTELWSRLIDPELPRY